MSIRCNCDSQIRARDETPVLNTILNPKVEVVAQSHEVVTRAHELVTQHHANRKSGTKNGQVFGVRKRHRFWTRPSYSDSAHPFFCEHPSFANLASVYERAHMHACPRALTRRRARQCVDTSVRAGASAHAARDEPHQRKHTQRVC